MAISKVILNGVTQMDVTDTTATAADVATGKVFYGADGVRTVGTSSGGGGEPVSRSDVNFYDYDGTLLHSYTATEAAELTALPNNPSHSGLVAQGWNYTLAQIKAEVTDHGKCDVGQMYVTDDDKTRIYCTFLKGRLSPYLGICVNGTVVVDWGDGSDTNIITGTSLSTVRTVQHTYASAGNYVITLTVSSGSFSFLGNSTATYLLTKNGTANTAGLVYANAFTRIELGSSAVIGNDAFHYCYSLSSITIPNSVTNIGTNAFYSCYSLSSITIPNSVTSLGESAFRGCYSLSSITIPNSVTNIGTYAFYSCVSLSSITIPNSVTNIGDSLLGSCVSLSSVAIPSSVTNIDASALSSCQTLVFVTIPTEVTEIGNSAFASCFGVSEYHLKPVTPPTLGSSAFRNIPSDCKIYVPYSQDHSILAAYKAATNWGTLKSYMLEEAA